MAEATGVMPKITTSVNTPTIDPSKTSNSIKVTGAPFQISTLQDREHWLKFLVYSRHGGGKTELAGTSVDVPEMRDILYINAERGSMTLMESPRIHNPQLIHSIEVNNYQTAATIQAFLKAYCKARDEKDIDKMRGLYCKVSGLKPEDVPNPPQYRTVIIDSLTELEVYCVYQLLKINIEGTDIGDDIDTAGWPEFRKNNEMVKLLVRAYRDLPMHVIFICSEAYTQDEQKKHHYSPALTGKLGSQVQGFVDIVGYLVVGSSSEAEPEAPRRLYVQPIAGGPKFDAKNRRSVYREAFFDNPNMSDIMRGTGLLK